MIEYRPTQIANNLGVLSVIVELQREPLDLTFAAFIQTELETGNYDEVLTAFITEMDKKGNRTGKHYIICPMFDAGKPIVVLGPPHNEDLQEFYLECSFNRNMVPEHLHDSWDILEGLTGKPWSICFTGAPTALILRFKYPSSQQMARVSIKLS